MREEVDPGRWSTLLLFERGVPLMPARRLRWVKVAGLSALYLVSECDLGDAVTRRGGAGLMLGLTWQSSQVGLFCNGRVCMFGKVGSLPLVTLDLKHLEVRLGELP